MSGSLEVARDVGKGIRSAIVGAFVCCGGAAGEAAAVQTDGGGFQNRPKYPLTFFNPWKIGGMR